MSITTKFDIFLKRYVNKSLCTKTITPEAFKPQGLLLHLAQIHSSRCAGFVFASFGDPPEIRTPDPLLKRQLLCQLS